jgi:hypothetical protein
MRKHALATLVMFLFLVATSWAQISYAVNFLATATALDASETHVNGTDFTSLNVSIPANQGSALFTVTFTRAAGAASKVSFYFQVSYDLAATWADFVDPMSGLECIEVLTNHTVVSGTTVRVSQMFMLIGASHIRLAKVVNADAANALTAVNASISW